jgi:hypothetical protein
MNSRPDPANNPLVKAFFIGRAVAELVAENVEKTATNWLSDLGKFDAEQRVNLRDFVEQVNTRADQALSQTAATPAGQTVSAPTTTGAATGSADLQATIDHLRAEIAEVRTELQRYRSRAN